MLILANDELFEFCVSCGEFGGNMKVFVEFVLRLIFVDLKQYVTDVFICFLARTANVPNMGVSFYK